jgi:hypothetical protein
MKSFKQFAEDGGAAGVGTGVAGVAGAGDDKNTVPVSKKMQKKYVAAAMGEQNDPDTQQQREKSKMSADVKQRKNADLVRTQTVQKHTLDRRASVLGPHSETPAVKAPSSGVSNRVGPQNPRKITGAVNMESFANFHKKNTKIKASDSGVGPQNFMTKENWVVKKGTEVVSKHKSKDDADVKAMKHPLYKVSADDVKEDTVKNQKELIASNSKTAENPTGFAKSTKGRLIDIGNQVLNKQKDK